MVHNMSDTTDRLLASDPESALSEHEDYVRHSSPEANQFLKVDEVVSVGSW